MRLNLMLDRRSRVLVAVNPTIHAKSSSHLRYAAVPPPDRPLSGALGAAADVAPNGADQVDPEALFGLDQQPGIGVAGVNQVLGREQVLVGQRLMDWGHDPVIGCGREACLDVRERRGRSSSQVSVR